MINPIPDLIKKKIKEFDYNSVTAQFALVGDEGYWKTIRCRFILDIDPPHGAKTLFKKDNFVLVDFSLSLEEFQEILDDLENFDMELNGEMCFKLGNYPIFFGGNFPGRELEFYGRQIMIRSHGIQKPAYFANYYIHQSVAGQLPRDLDLTDYEIPLRDGVEAINYFWKTNFEYHEINSHNCQIYMPIYDASIKKVSLDNTKFKIKLEINPSTKKDDLSLAIIATAPGNHQYRKKHKIMKDEMEIDILFTPNVASVHLNKNGKNLDVYNYYPPSQFEDYLPKDELIPEQQMNLSEKTNHEHPKPFLKIEHFHDPFYRNLVEQINKCYRYGMPDIALERIRKLFENLLIDILKKKYQEDISSYKGANDKHLKFHLIVKNTKEKIQQGEFDHVKKEFEEAIDGIDKLRDKGNKSTHSITFDVKKSYLDEIHDEIERKVDLFLRIFSMI